MPAPPDMRLRDLLAIPYRLRAETIEAGVAPSRMRLSYPELSDCVAEGTQLEDVLADLERQRMTLIVSLLERGGLPPMPRPPLTDCDPLWTARELGANPRVIAALEQA